MKKIKQHLSYLLESSIELLPGILLVFYVSSKLLNSPVIKNISWDELMYAILIAGMSFMLSIFNHKTSFNVNNVRQFLIIGLSFMSIVFVIIPEKINEPANFIILLLSSMVVGVFIYLNNIVRNLMMSEKKYKEKSEYDAMTGLYNQGFFKDFINFNGEQNLFNVSVAIMDIDHFKKINDTYGHAAGDRVIKMFTRIIKEESRENITSFRVGGEEFALFTTKLSKDNFIKVVEKIHKRVKETVINLKTDNNNQQVKITVSGGIAYASATKKPLDIFKLYELADQCLYNSKKNGRDQITVYSSKLQMTPTPKK